MGTHNFLKVIGLGKAITYNKVIGGKQRGYRKLWKVNEYGLGKLYKVAYNIQPTRVRYRYKGPGNVRSFINFIKLL